MTTSRVSVSAHISPVQRRRTSVLTDGVEGRDDARGGRAPVARRVWNRARDRADDGRALQGRVAVRPDGDEPADVVVNPLLAADESFALKPHLHRRAVGARAVKRERPAVAADGADEQLRLGLFDDDVSAFEFELVEVGVDVRIVQQAAVSPRADERVIAHDVSSVRSTLMYFLSGEGEFNFAPVRYGLRTTKPRRFHSVTILRSPAGVCGTPRDQFRYCRMGWPPLKPTTSQV